MTTNASTAYIAPAGLPMAVLLAELHQACFDDPWDAKTMGELLSMPGACAFVIGKDPKRPVGFVMANCAADQADILAIGILPGHRRDQLGNRLLRHLSDHLRSLDVTVVFLEVAADNAAAMGLYKACGYIEVGRRENYYPPHRSDRTAVQMKCELGL